MKSFLKRVSMGVAALAISTAISGCATDAQNIGLGLATAYLARTPSNEIEQIYYLGTFDPQEQIPPTIYRVRVRGQASAISLTKFASGWVKGALIDSLGTNIGFSAGKDGGITKDQGAIQNQDLANVASERRFIVFGPEGFREVPKDHRLVIVMGSSPEAFFSAMDEALGKTAETQVQVSEEELNRRLLTTLLMLNEEEDRLTNLAEDVAVDFPKERP
jgi:hypothetical protein